MLLTVTRGDQESRGQLSILSGKVFKDLGYLR